MWDPYADFEKVVLPNGLEIYVAHWPHVNWIRGGFIIHSGASQDLVDKEGTAHFVEHLVSENADVEQQQMKNFFENCGGFINLGATGYFFTEYKFMISSEIDTFKEGIEHFASMLTNVRLEKQIEREREVIYQEINRKFGIQWMIDDGLWQHKVLYPGCFLERFISPFGLKDSVNLITKDDLQNFVNKHYVPSNMSLVFVGGLSMSEIVDVISQTSFSEEGSSYRTNRILSVPVVDKLGNTKKTTVLSEKGVHGVERSYYRLSAKIPNIYTQETFGILNEILNEILFDEIRKKNAFAYDFQSDFTNLQYFTEFNIQGMIASGSEMAVSNIVDFTLKQLQDKHVLFARIKNALVRSRELIDTNGKRMIDSSMLDICQFGRIITAQEERDAFEQVSFEEMLEVATFLAQDYRLEYVQVP